MFFDPSIFLFLLLLLKVLTNMQARGLVGWLGLRTNDKVSGAPKSHRVIGQKRDLVVTIGGYYILQDLDCTTQA